MTITLAWELACALAGSFLTCALLVLTQRWHGRLSLDHDLGGAQKIHAMPVPRVGGLALVVSLSTGIYVSYSLTGNAPMLAIQLLACSAPVFVAGFAEDLTKKVSVRARLWGSFAAGALAIWGVGAQLERLDTPLLDAAANFWPLLPLFTCFAVGGMTNAVNIVDGLNGLASGCVALMLAGLALIAWQVGDLVIVDMALLGAAALLGFLILNFPFGRIFLGDGGAYLAGFWLAECGVLLLQRNPQVSTWAVLVCCFYPVWETVYSIYRRRAVHGVGTGVADTGHLHHLIYKLVSHSDLIPAMPPWLRHAVSTACIWSMVLVCQIASALLYQNSGALMLCSLAFVIAYHHLYARFEKQTRPRSSDTPGYPAL